MECQLTRSKDQGEDPFQKSPLNRSRPSVPHGTHFFLCIFYHFLNYLHNTLEIILLLNSVTDRGVLVCIFCCYRGCWVYEKSWNYMKETSLSDNGTAWLSSLWRLSIYNHTTSVDEMFVWKGPYIQVQQIKSKLSLKHTTTWSPVHGIWPLTDAVW